MKVPGRDCEKAMDDLLVSCSGREHNTLNLTRSTLN